MTDSGYIYISRQEFSPPGIYKIGKTVNMKSTCRTYKRQGNIKIGQIFVTDYLCYIENILLNIVGPYRTVREDKKKLSEQVHLPLLVIISIITWIVDRVKNNGHEIIIKASRNINTMFKYRQKIPNDIWKELCIHLDKECPSYMIFPMDIDDNEESNKQLILISFDNFINNYKRNIENYSENLT